MIKHIEIEAKLLRTQIRQQLIAYAGNKKLFIYGTLQCKSGKRMKNSNRVFFKSIEEAKTFGYRPCGHCMKKEYAIWKDESIQR